MGRKRINLPKEALGQIIARANLVPVDFTVEEFESIVDRVEAWRAEWIHEEMRPAVSEYRKADPAATFGYRFPPALWTPDNIDELLGLDGREGKPGTSREKFLYRIEAAWTFRLESNLRKAKLDPWIPLMLRCPAAPFDASPIEPTGSVFDALEPDFLYRFALLAFKQIVSEVLSVDAAALRELVAKTARFENVHGVRFQTRLTVWNTWKLLPDGTLHKESTGFPNVLDRIVGEKWRVERLRICPVCRRIFYQKKTTSETCGVPACAYRHCRRKAKSGLGEVS